MKSIKGIALGLALCCLWSSCKDDDKEAEPDGGQQTTSLFNGTSPATAVLDGGIWNVPNNLPIDQNASVNVSDAMVWNNAPLVSVASVGGAGAGGLQLKTFDGSNWNFLADGNYLLTQTANGELYGLQQKFNNPQNEVILAKLSPGATEWTTLLSEMVPNATFRFNYLLPEGNELYQLRNLGDLSTPSSWKLSLSKWNGTDWDLVTDHALASYAPKVASNSVNVYHFGSQYIIRMVLLDPGTSKQEYVFFELESGSLKEIYRYDETASQNIQLGKVLWANGQYYFAAVDQLYTISNGQLNSEVQVEPNHNWYWADSDGENIFLWTADGGSGVHIYVKNKSGQWAKLPLNTDYTNTAHKFSMGRLYWLYKHMSFFEWNNQLVFVGTSDYSQVDYSIAAFYAK